MMDVGSTVFTIVSPDGTHQTSVTDMSASSAEIGAVNQFQNVMLDCERTCRTTSSAMTSHTPSTGCG